MISTNLDGKLIMIMINYVDFICNDDFEQNKIFFFKTSNYA